MPEWAIDALKTFVIPALASIGAYVLAWRRFSLERKAQSEKGKEDREKLLRSVADTASATALECLEAATKELRQQGNELRGQVDMLRERLSKTERELADARREMADERRGSAQMAERIRQLETEREGLLRRISELEGRK